MINRAALLKELDRLKDFQRDTVAHVFKRMYLDDPPATRYLVADEVGLGKTMVARGLIAKTIDHLYDTVKRIDVIYICSNAAIAHQNLNRINILADRQHTFATRLTLLPTQLGALKNQKVNFVSFTPGTTFDLKSRGGIVAERSLLLRMLSGEPGMGGAGLRNLMQGAATKAGWQRHLEAPVEGEIDSDLANGFLAALKKAPLFALLGEVVERFKRYRESLPDDDVERRSDVIGQLRGLLAKTCVDALEPDLVILDEFQRFKDLLHANNEAADLAKQLFDYKDVRTLLLSATPYRMVTMADETEDDHQRDFLETVDFLSDDRSQVALLKTDLSDYRRALLSTDHESQNGAIAAKNNIEKRLRSVMVRTERVESTTERDAMLEEHAIHAPLTADDLRQALMVGRISQRLGAGDTVEYWKSSPYLLNFMRNYEVKDKLRSASPDEAKDIAATLQDGSGHLLDRRTFSQYEPIAYGNPRLRALAAATIDAGQWRLLWLPPSMPYFEATGPYADLGPTAKTKSLVFSSWNVVPDTIAGLLSYEAERRMVTEMDDKPAYEELGDRRKPLLLFRMNAAQKPTGMPVLALMYPCVTLARYVDPLDVALDLGEGKPASLDAARERVGAIVTKLVDKLVREYGTTDGQPDQRWYWATPALLDAKNQDVVAWIGSRSGLRGLYAEEQDSDDDGDSGYEKHVDHLLEVLNHRERLGPPPVDLGRVMADFALASPAICAVRAIQRVAALSDPADSSVMNAAAHVAKGFRTLFNVPETMALLKGNENDERMPYWRRVLEYCVDGNLQAVLDEYAHMLVEGTGMTAKPGSDIAKEVADQMVKALSPRSSNLTIDHIQPHGGRIEITPFRLRCRFALRFGDLRDENGSALERADTVREAFNSPFRPFVLASTSIGQEGLDFHPYCHSIWHWNLPSNPVDLEQREGRVHRFKGHAVRRSIAHRYGLQAFLNQWAGAGDPWARLFALATLDRPEKQSDLVPYWLFEAPGSFKVERRIPLIPLSREVDDLVRLKKSLAVYRLTFGQARQEDLISYLTELDESRRTRLLETRIRLGPEQARRL